MLVRIDRNNRKVLLLAEENVMQQIKDMATETMNASLRRTASETLIYEGVSPIFIPTRVRTTLTKYAPRFYSLSQPIRTAIGVWILLNGLHLALHFGWTICNTIVANISFVFVLKSLNYLGYSNALKNRSCPLSALH